MRTMGIDTEEYLLFGGGGGGGGGGGVYTMPHPQTYLGGHISANTNSITISDLIRMSTW